MGSRQGDNLVLRFGPFEADLHTRELRKNGRTISLPPQPFKVLALLASRSGELVTREEIQHELWGGDTFVDFEQGLNFCIKRLRAALSDDPDRPRYIETLPRRGYRFVAGVEKTHSTAAPSEESPPQAPVSISEANPERGTFSRASAAHSEQPSAAVLEAEEETDVAVSVRLAGWSLKFLSRNKRTYWVAMVATILFSIVGVVTVRNRLVGPSHPLTEKDTIVLADFANRTSDPVFSEALKAGLAADLSQSTFLNILSDDAVSQELRYMGRADSALTPEVAREVCQRSGSLAMLIGSISSIGSHYAITLKAVNCSDGAALDIEQAEADRRESVLWNLHKVARDMRKRLGESLASIEKHDAPLEQATTSSLEALQAYSQAQKTWRSQGESAAIGSFRRALELDPHFAAAMVDLGIMYCNLNEKKLCAEYTSKAYQLRDHVTERERFSVDSSYYTDVTGELEKAAQALEDWKELYPRDLGPYINLAEVDWDLGRLDAALGNDLQGFALKKDRPLVYGHLSSDYMSLNRLDDAKVVLDEARRRKLDGPLVESYYQLAFLRSDHQEMERCIAAAQKSSEDESTILASESDTEAFYGLLKKARETSRRAVAAAVSTGDKEAAAGWEVTEALREAEVGNKRESTQHAIAALSLADSRNVEIAAAMALARAGDTHRAEAMTVSLQKRFPSDTLLLKYWLPSIRASIDLARKKPVDAINDLQVTSAYELGGGVLPFSLGASMYPVYLRGLSYLELKQAENAENEFQRIRDHSGLVWNSPLAALVQLELGRSFAQGGARERARVEYRKFLSTWHEADSDIPAFARARKEYALLSN